MSKTTWLVCVARLGLKSLCRPRGHLGVFSCHRPARSRCRRHQGHSYNNGSVRCKSVRNLLHHRRGLVCVCIGRGAHRRSNTSCWEDSSKSPDPRRIWRLFGRRHGRVFRRHCGGHDRYRSACLWGRPAPRRSWGVRDNTLARFFGRTAGQGRVADWSADRSAPSVGRLVLSADRSDLSGVRGR